MPYKQKIQIDTSTENAALIGQWRSRITMGATAAEKRMIAEAEERRRKRKELAYYQPPKTRTHMCHACNTFLGDQNRSHQPY